MITAFTVSDNKSLDIVRIVFLLTIIFLCGLEGFFVIFRAGTFDPIAFSTGASTLIAATGASLKLKNGTEPGDAQK